MLSSWRELGRIVFGKRRSGQNHKQMRIREQLQRASSCIVEQLEARQLLSVLPAPTIGQHVNLSGGANNQNMSNPAVAYDPSNPLKLVSVYTRYQPSIPGRQKSFLEGSYSADGGVSWVNFGLPRNDPNWTLDPAAVNDRTQQRATDASVAIGRDEQVFITFLEHDDDDSVGGVMFYKFDFSGGSPQPVQIDASRPGGGKRLYTWVGADQALTPMVAVDNNIDDFVDPDTGAEQFDANVGNVYIAWTTNTPPPPNFDPNLWNQNAIVLVASGDGGVSFSSEQMLNDNRHSMVFGARPEGRMSTPRLVISQGTVPDALSGEPRVNGGQVTIVWDDWTGTGNGGDDTDIIWADRISDGVKAINVEGEVGPIADPPQATPPLDTDFIATVNIVDDPNDPLPFTLSDLNVNLTLTHNALAEISVTLIAPDGTQVPLFLNGIDANGQTIPNQGITGTDLGVLAINNFRTDLGTVFDDDAALGIRQSARQDFIGHFRP
ncbi:MAG TPA: hypothetical protein VGP94_10980, partial [Tepidisphaeraceae bacterium]|nr:hypothetical protein [Tepidisphaeraceae bacterium]